MITEIHSETLAKAKDFCRNTDRKKRQKKTVGIVEAGTSQLGY